MNTNVTINIEGTGAAFDEPTAEVARILRDLAEKIEDGGYHFKHLYDLNGNKCGTVSINITPNED